METILRFCGVSKIFKKRWVAISDVSFEMTKGEFVFLVGPSGAGKTTVMRIIYFAERPDMGECWVCGFSSNTVKDEEIPFLRRRLGIVFQDFKLLEDKTAYENIELPLLVRGIRRKERRAKTLAILEELGLKDKAGLFPHQLSGGERQRVALGRAIANDPLLLLADEPTGNLDPVTSEEIMEILFKIHRRGTAILMATHNMNLVEDYGNRIIALDHGRIVDDMKGRR